MAVQHEIPTVDVSPYLDPGAPESARNDVVAQVKSACEQYGFFQLVGHGIPIDLQRRALDCAKTFFALPQEQKDVLAMSNAMGNSKRGYERLGGQLLDKKPDLKEGFYIGKELPADHPEAGQFLKGPNQWPDLPKNLLEEPIMEYREALVKLDTLLMQILAEGLDQPPEVMESFTRDPVANLKLLHYPPQISKDKDQFGGE
ncbi:hypothetical protein M8818_005567 [Zalaria obscura]|uniref:Uncharacterized protein n=1 Tax=Zalaria obscura TaxID=2024903 RepID=A0ACC3S8V3_9PEZI